MQTKEHEKPKRALWAHSQSLNQRSPQLQSRRWPADQQQQVQHLRRSLRSFSFDPSKRAPLLHHIEVRTGQLQFIIRRRRFVSLAAEASFVSRYRVVVIRFV